MEYLKKGALGYRAVNYEDAEYAAVRISDYEKLKRQVSDLEYDLKKEKEGRAHDKELYEKRISQNWTEAEKEANEAAKEYLKKAEVAEKEAQRLNALNSTLKKMAKEKANQERNIRPKVEHPGYMLIGKVIQTNMIVGYEKKGKEKIPIRKNVWVTTIETPYSCMIPLAEIDREIFKELKGEKGIFERMGTYGYGISGDTGNLWKGDYADAVSSANTDLRKSGIFDWHFQANTFTRRWELQITTIGPIKIPEEMLYEHSKRSKVKKIDEKEQKRLQRRANEAAAEMQNDEDQQEYDIDKYQLSILSLIHI